MATFFSITTTKVAWFLILLTFLVVAIQVHSQLDSLGFITIDCGLRENSSFIDQRTSLPHYSDTQFIDTGTNYPVSSPYLQLSIERQFLNLRSFATGTRNCYTLKSLEAGSKYLIRAKFFYGNYDGLNKLPSFDLYFGVNYWKTISIPAADHLSGAELIAVIPDNQVQICLVNTGLGTPFISLLELRPVKKNLYPAANATQAIVYYNRLNAGSTDNAMIRYPIDPYDRIWIPWNNAPTWTVVSTNSSIQNLANDQFEVPSAVMQTAVTPVNLTQIEFYWLPFPEDKNPVYVTAWHFSEFQKSNASRDFNMYLNDKQWYDAYPSLLFDHYAYCLYDVDPIPQYSRYDVSIAATSKSALPPILNAVELFTLLYITEIATDSGDVSAIVGIKAKYKVSRDWIGDPCAPKAYAWNGLSCSYHTSNAPRITTLNLSSSGLTGDITISFANLKALQYLDLSHNSLTGAIPDELSQLESLKLLDLTSNKLSGSIPIGLLKRSQNGSLTLSTLPDSVCSFNPYQCCTCFHRAVEILLRRTGDNKDLCANKSSCGLPQKKNSSMILIVVIVPVVVVLLLLVILILWIRRKRQGPHIDYPSKSGDYEGSSLQHENQRFTYMELVTITNDFKREIGRGVLGRVYDGFLENGTQVAVKMRSQSSVQGVKEFLAEARNLTRVHHNNLVSMIGYCNDGDYLGLVYEYMSEGTLQDHLIGKSSNNKPLTWRQRLRIAHESSQGLEYLHKGCNPPLIHRDMKTRHILLNANLEAKIADFGLSDVLIGDILDHVPTAMAGTPGYVDPEVVAISKVSEKSDVYSFGVILLEIITAKPPILQGPERGHIIEWVGQRLDRGIIEDVVDPRMQGEYDLNSVRKVAALALECTMTSYRMRPTMTYVVEQLNECLELEKAGQRTHYVNSGSSDPNSDV